MLNEYLNKLEYELDKRNIEEKNDILQYFEEMITDRVESGEKIEDVITSLGDASSLVTSLFGPSDHEEEKRENSTNRKFEEFYDVREIKIDNVSYDISFTKASGRTVSVEFNDDEYNTLKIRYEHGKLKIEQECFKGLDRFFNAFSKLFSNDRKETFGNYKAVITIPENSELDLNVETVNGDLEFEEIQAGRLRINGVNGDMSFDHCAFERNEIDSVNGDIEIRDMSILDRFKTDLVSADLKADMLRCEEIRIESVSGDVDLLIDGQADQYDVKISKVLKEQSYQGRGRGKLRIETVSGDISYSFTR